MFIKESSFKKLIKAAAKHTDGLHVKNDGEGIWLVAPRWSMWILKGMIPKEHLGDLIALIGWLPDKGEAINVSKGVVQTEMYETVAESAIEKYRKCNMHFEVTRTQINEDGWLRVLQSNNSTLKAFCIDEDLYGAIDITGIDMDAGEELPTGPALDTEGGISLVTYENGACWMNNHMAFSVKLHVMRYMGRQLEEMSEIRMVRVDEREAGAWDDEN